MIISRTPLRMSFVGGGSDMPVFYEKYGGAVVSTAIDKYVYITVNEKFDHHIRVSYSKTEEVEHVDQIEHKIVRETLKLLKIDGGIEITSISDIPARGTGLGSSSSFTVGLLHCLSAFNRQFASAAYLAEQSCNLEIDICREPIGKQDQYAAAYGGLNFIQFNCDGLVFVDPIICHRETLQRLERNTLVFYTGINRSASALLKNQNEALKSSSNKQAILKQMVQLAYDLRAELQRNHLESFGEILHENWLLKKQLADGISAGTIDDWYQRGIEAGATGGKLLGAGSGGFLMFYALEEKHERIIRALPELRRIKLGYERQGSKIIFVH